MSWISGCCGSSRKGGEQGATEMRRRSTGPDSESPGDGAARRPYSETLSPRRLLELTQAMDDIELEQIIAKVPLFNSLKAEEVSKVARGLQYRAVSHGEYIYRQNDVGDCFYIIVGGHVEKVVEGAAGSNKPDIVIGKLLEPGMYFGQMALVNTDDRRSCSMRARGRVELRYIERARMNKLIGNLTTILQRSHSKFSVYEAQIKARRHSGFVEGVEAQSSILRAVSDEADRGGGFV